MDVSINCTFGCYNYVMYYIVVLMNLFFYEYNRHVTSGDGLTTRIGHYDVISAHSNEI